MPSDYTPLKGKVTLMNPEEIDISRNTAFPSEEAASGKQQIGGNHYSKRKIQPWDIVDEYKLNFYEGNILKYLLRSKEDRQEDVKKLIHYAQKLLETLEG